MVPEIWSATDIIFCHFELFFALLPPPPPNNLANQTFKKLKKTPEGIIILHKCTINDDHMMYGSRYMKHERKNLFVIWIIFCPFTPLTTQKIKILKK